MLFAKEDAKNFDTGISGRLYVIQIIELAQTKKWHESLQSYIKFVRHPQDLVSAVTIEDVNKARLLLEKALSESIAPWSLLNVAVGATAKVRRQAYLNLARQCHPDRVSVSARATEEANFLFQLIERAKVKIEASSNRYV